MSHPSSYAWQLAKCMCGETKRIYWYSEGLVDLFAITVHLNPTGHPCEIFEWHVRQHLHHHHHHRNTNWGKNVLEVHCSSLQYISTDTENIFQAELKLFWMPVTLAGPFILFYFVTHLYSRLIFFMFSPGFHRNYGNLTCNPTRIKQFSRNSYADATPL